MRSGRRAGGLALLLALGLAVPACGGDAGPPPVLLVVIDTLRADRLPSAGYGRETAPALAALAEDSVVFTQAWAAASWTRPSVASLHTGLWARRHGAIHWDEGLGDVPTLARWLSARGRPTHAAVANPFLEDAGFEAGFDEYLELSRGGRWHVPGREVTVSAKTWGPLAPGELRWVHYLDPHDPYRPGASARDALVEPYEGPARGGMAFLRTRLLPGRVQLEPPDVRHLSQLYDAEVRTADAALGALLDWLRRTDRYEEALVIVTSDHGEELHDRGGWLHGYTLYEEQLHVPLIVKPPRSLGVEPGRRSRPVSLVDVAPTVLDVVGLPVPEGLDGRSLVPLLRGERPPARTLFALEPLARHGGERPPARTLFALEPLARHGGERTGRAAAARRGSLKWIEVEGRYPYADTPPGGECYDLAEDPRERRNLAAGAGEQACEPLAQALRRHLGEARRPGRALEIDPEVRERLEALGYTP